MDASETAEMLLEKAEVSLPPTCRNRATAIYTPAATAPLRIEVPSARRGALALLNLLINRAFATFLLQVLTRFPKTHPDLQWNIPHVLKRPGSSESLKAAGRFWRRVTSSAKELERGMPPHRSPATGEPIRAYSPPAWRGALLHTSGEQL